VGSHHIIKVRNRTEEEAAETAVKEEAEGQWCQKTIDADTKDRKRAFHEDNEKWAVKVYRYEQIMQKQDEELRQLEHRKNIDTSSAEHDNHGTLGRHNNITSVETESGTPAASKHHQAKLVKSTFKPSLWLSDSFRQHSRIAASISS
jgi:hypothetical protein